MANLYISEFAAISSGAPQVAQFPVKQTQVLEIVPNEIKSEQFTGTTAILYLLAEQDCLIDIAAQPSVATNGTPLSAGIPVHFGVPNGAYLAVRSK